MTRHAACVTIWIVLVVQLIGGGCAAEPRYKNASTTLPTTLPETTGLAAPEYLDVLGATVVAPVGWTREPLKTSSRHAHQVWLSPSGRTAYGVIHFSLPVPLGYDPVLWYFMREMRRVEREAELLSKQWDPNLRGLRFVAQGGRYTIRPNLLLRGFKGWAIYAGTLTHQPIDPAELDLAERARERTMTGRVAASKAVAVGDHPGR
jgi:hypothetical protein